MRPNHDPDPLNAAETIVLACAAHGLSKKEPRGGHAVNLCLASGTIAAGAHTSRLSTRELEILTVIALAARPCSSDCLVERVWPDVENCRARRSLKVYIHRIRKRVNCPSVLILESRRWMLGCSVQVDLHAWDALVASAGTLPLAPSTREALAQAWKQLGCGVPESMAYSPLYGSLDFAIASLLQRVASLLASDAFATGDPARALGIARDMLRIDPYAEPWHEAVIRCHLKLGDEAAARRHARIYAALLRDELNLPLPGSLRNLVAGNDSIAV
jgi:two-component SAPR family response regulator